MRRETLITLLTGAALAFAILSPLGAFLFIKSGLYDVAASKPHTTLTEWITHETMIHSAKRRAAAIVEPQNVAASQVVGGFCSYEAHCVACHGAPAVAREQWVSGMEPQPPYLVDAAAKWTPAQLFWIVKNGIKMTGMPAWRDSLSDSDIWEVVGYLEAMRARSPRTHQRWRNEGRCAPNVSSAPSGLQPRAR